MAWKEVEHQSGRYYYFNSDTKETTWEKPEALYSAAEIALAKKGWKKYFSKESKRYYYYNTKTKKTTWEAPSVEVENGDTSVDNESDNVEKLVTTESKSSKYENMFKRTPNNFYKESSKTDSKKAFLDLLEDTKVDTTWSFQKFMESAIKDPRYWQVDDTIEKKQLFEEYLVNKTKKEIARHTNTKEKFQNEFKLLLQQYSSSIHYYSRWHSFKKLVKREPIYEHSMLSEKEKRAHFNTVVAALRKEHDAEIESLKSQALAEFRHYFSTYLNQFTESGGWEKVLNTIETDKRALQNKNFKKLTKLNFASVYIENLTSLIGQYQREIHKLEHNNFREDRKARDAFRGLLTDMKNDNVFSVQSTFDEVYPYIKDDQSFVNLLGRNGSMPIELFWDVIEEQNLYLRAQKDIVFNSLLEKGFKILEQPKQSFLSIIEDEKLVAGDREFLQENKELIYEILVKQSLDDLKRRKNAITGRFETRKADYKKQLVGYLRKIVTGSTPSDKIKSAGELKWESVASSVMNQSFFTAMLQFYRQNYTVLEGLKLEKILDYDYFVEHLHEEGTEWLKLEKNDSAEIEESVLSSLMSQAVSELKEDLLKESVRSIKKAPVDEMELDY